VNANEDVRAVTRKPGMRTRALMTSSARPSPKYRSRTSPARFWNGSTATEAPSSRGGSTPARIQASISGFSENTHGRRPPPGNRCTGSSRARAQRWTRRILGRSEVQTWWPVNPSPSVTELLTPGEITFVVNCNFNSEYRGPCWGTFRWATADGTWEGQWTAPVMDLFTYESRLSMVGFGQGGAIDGKQLKFDRGSAAFDYYITGSIRIH
jgi:hypothetical protein